MKRIEPLIEYDEELGISTCLLFYENQSFYGMAQCNEKDKDFQNKMTGEHIAYERAMIQALQFEKNNIIKPKINALKQLYYSMNKSKKFNPKSYEAKMLYRQIKNQTEDLVVVNDLIQTKQKALRDYINLKDKSYQTLRKMRNKEDLEANNN